MTYYGILRLKVTGTFIGEFCFGNTLEYKGRRYLICSLLYNTHNATGEVILLQIAGAPATAADAEGGYLGTESGIFIGTESGDYIVLPGLDRRRA
jgi:hypothetical protein